MAAGTATRTHKGSRLQDTFPQKPASLQLSDIDSAFPLQEYIAHLVQRDPHDVTAIVNIPGSLKEGAGLGLGIDEKADGGVDESCWIYEQLRRLAQDLTHPLITALQAECNRTTCPEMKAGEWLYLCVAHGTGPSAPTEQCCAIDYITHTLDSATALLNSPRAFPSRLQIPTSSTRQFPSLARRLSRIFAHAYYHHREAFEQSEAESSLYARFLLLAKRFDLVPQDLLVLPGSSTSQESVPLPPQSEPPPPQQRFQMPTLTIAAEQAPGPPSTVERPRAGASLPMQRTSNTLAGYPPEDRGGALPTRQDSVSYGNTTVKNLDSDVDRRAILNRSRTDTMYMKDFDLSEFAAAAGDAMAAVNAENAPRQEDHDDDEDPFLEVEKDDIHDEPEETEKPIEIENDAEGLAPTAGSNTKDTVPAEPSCEEPAVLHVDDETLELQKPSKVERGPEAGVVKDEEDGQEHPIHLEHGEVKSVPAHLGLDSEAAKDEEVTWGEPVGHEPEAND